MTLRRAPRIAIPIIALLACAWFLFFFALPGSDIRPWHQKPKSTVAAAATATSSTTPDGDDKKPEVEIVVASLKSEKTTWFAQYLSHWSRKIYVVDDHKAPLTVVNNVGRESMVYLTYIIDNYDALPEIVIFHHAERFQWHNDNPDYDALVNLQRLRLDHVRSEGYVNLRCVWVLGCPTEIRPHVEAEAAEGADKRKTGHVYKGAFERLLPEVAVPDRVGVTCCSQFAVTAGTIRRRPRKDYEHYRDWLLTTPLTSDLSGRVMEYSWHIIFGKESIHCPRAGDCYCKLYGMCDLVCRDGDCEGRYVLPKVATLPSGWPVTGWNGEDRNFTGPPV